MAISLLGLPHPDDGAFEILRFCLRQHVMPAPQQSRSKVPKGPSEAWFGTNRCGMLWLASSEHVQILSGPFLNTETLFCEWAIELKISCISTAFLPHFVAARFTSNHSIAAGWPWHVTVLGIFWTIVIFANLLFLQWRTQKLHTAPTPIFVVLLITFGYLGIFPQVNQYSIIYSIIFYT